MMYQEQIDACLRAAQALLDSTDSLHSGDIREQWIKCQALRKALDSSPGTEADKLQDSGKALREIEQKLHEKLVELVNREKQVAAQRREEKEQEEYEQKLRLCVKYLDVINSELIAATGWNLGGAYWDMERDGPAWDYYDRVMKNSDERKKCPELQELFKTLTTYEGDEACRRYSQKPSNERTQLEREFAKAREKFLQIVTTPGFHRRLESTDQVEGREPQILPWIPKVLYILLQFRRARQPMVHNFHSERSEEELDMCYEALSEEFFSGTTWDDFLAAFGQIPGKQGRIKWTHTSKRSRGEESGNKSWQEMIDFVYVVTGETRKYSQLPSQEVQSDFVANFMEVFGIEKESGQKQALQRALSKYEPGTGSRNHREFLASFATTTPEADPDARKLRDMIQNGRENE